MSVVDQQIVDIATKCYNCKNAQCVKYCPLSNDIPSIMQCVKNGDIEQASNILRQTTLFGAICGVVCPRYRQCEGHCIRGLKGDAVEIGKVESYLAKLNTQRVLDIQKVNKKVAVVGSGPSGIACALQLLELGFDVTIYEKNSKLGGIMRYGIPPFRLDKQPIDDLTELLKKLQCKLVTNCTLGKDIQLNELLQQFDAVYLAVGLQKSVPLGVEGQDAQGVISGDDYLANPTRAKRVVVVGGGNASVDCARTALRHSDSVTMVYRRTREQMPAYSDEVDIAISEGVHFEFLVQPLKVETMDGKVSGITLCKMQLDKVGSDGRATVKPTNEQITLPCDTVIFAIGNRLQGEFLPNCANNRVIVDEKYHTSIDRVYAGGDMVNTVNTVVYAVKEGKEAGQQIARDLGVIKA